MSNSYIIKLNSGRVDRYPSSGADERIICTGARSAVLQVDEVHVTMPDGKVRIHRVSGAYVRTI